MGFVSNDFTVNKFIFASNFFNAFCEKEKFAKKTRIVRGS